MNQEEIMAEASRRIAEYLFKICENHSDPRVKKLAHLSKPAGELAAWLSRKYGKRLLEYFSSNSSLDDAHMITRVTERIIDMEESGSVAERVRQIIVDELGVDEGEVTANARFIEDLGADSLDTVEIVMRMEETFGILIPDEDAEKLASVRDVIEYVEGNSL